MAKKRPFGTKRTLPSGRVQATYIGPDGLRHKVQHRLGYLSPDEHRAQTSAIT
jgi:hypothetical protein